MQCQPFTPGEGGSDRPIDLRDVRVLIVEDDPPGARMLFAALTSEGCEVRVASSAEEGLDVLYHFDAAVIVLDLVLPRMSGLLLARELKAAAVTCDIVIIAVSFLNGPETERLALEAGCDAFLQKPLGTSTLVRTIAHLLPRI